MVAADALQVLAADAVAANRAAVDAVVETVAAPSLVPMRLSPVLEVVAQPRSKRRFGFQTS
jgi:hypothetical protein